MKKRIFSVLLCVCMLIGMLGVPTFAAGAVESGRKAVANFDCTMHKKAVTTGHAGTVQEGATVEVAEAYLTGEDGSTKFHKLVAYLNGSTTYRYIEAYDSNGNEALSPYSADNAPKTPAASTGPETTEAWLFVDAPVAGEMPDESIEVTGDTDMYVEDYTWKGEFNADGSFKEGVKYTIVITVSLDDNANKVFSSRPADHGVNRFPPTIKLSNNNRTVELTYNFAQAKAPKESTAPKKEDSKDATAVKVDTFAAGDYGTMYLISGGYSIYHEPDSRTMYGSSQNTEATITVLEAGVDGVDTDAVYYAIWNERLQEVDYVNMNDAKATFGNFAKEGNDPERPYNEMFAEKRSKAREISEIGVTVLYAAADRAPYLLDEESIAEFAKENHYTLTKTVFSTQGTPAPLELVTATLTYVAVDGYHFSKDVTTTVEETTGRLETENNVSRMNNRFKINHIDEKTIEVVYHEYVDPVHEIIPQPTQSMLEYNDTHTPKNANAVPIMGTAKISPYAAGSVTATQQYPIFSNLSGSNASGTMVEIIDWDITDEIPDMVGQWCRVRVARELGFLPKNVLSEVVLTNFWEGSPGTIHDSPYNAFAGGSGTREDPFLIETAEQLDAVRKGPKKCYKLIADIDLSDWGNWIPIGGTPAYGGHGDDVYNKAQFGSTGFGGHLDGNGHVISGMTIKIDETVPYMQEKGNSRYYGLFSKLGAAPEHQGYAGVSNLGLINYTIDVTYRAYSESIIAWAGAIAADGVGGAFTDCYTANGTIHINFHPAEGTEPQTWLEIGGITGELALANMTRCANNGDVTVRGEHFDYLIAGGLAGKLVGGDILESYNTGDITVPVGEELSGVGSTKAGGLFAEAQKARDPKVLEHLKVENSYNTGHITASSVAGFAIYLHTNIFCEFINCYNIGELTSFESHPDDPMPRKSALGLFTDGMTITGSYPNGTSVSGSAWRHSDKFGRKVLISNPEDTFTVPEVHAKPSAPKAQIVGTFVDVPVSAWYAEPVKWAVDNKITAGTSSTTFSPDMTCTKAQIITFIWRAMGEPMYTIPHSFTDVNYKDYYSIASQWAHEKGMVEAGTFGADKFITRADTVVYLWKMAGSPDVSTVGTFTDVPADASYAKAVAWAVANGITSGTSDTTFSPDMTCTRGHIVTFLQRAVK